MKSSLIKEKYKNPISKKEREEASMIVVKTLLEENVPIEEIVYLSGKEKEKIEKIAKNIEKNKVKWKNDKNYESKIFTIKSYSKSFR